MKNYSKEQVLKFFEQMYLVRYFEEKTAQLYSEGLVAGFCHLYIGQEAVVVGTINAISTQDSVITSYREHGHMLVCGADPKIVMAELTGRSTGCSKGKGGSMHMFSREKNFYGGHGIVGACVPIGTGIAFAHKYNKTGAICLTYMGDGTLNQGQVSEAFNMAALWKLPIIYIIENNLYALGTSLKRARACTDLYKAGTAFNIPGEQVDGMDVFSVHKKTQEAVEYVKNGNGPIILELKTYRYKGHSMSDPANYRTKEELETYKKRDPLDMIKNTKDPIKNVKQLLTESEIQAVEEKVKKIVKNAVEFARTSPEPEDKDLYADVLF